MPSLAALCLASLHRQSAAINLRDVQIVESHVDATLPA
jgi:hypothetical protein